MHIAWMMVHGEPTKISYYINARGQYMVQDGEEEITCHPSFITESRGECISNHINFIRDSIVSLQKLAIEKENLIEVWAQDNDFIEYIHRRGNGKDVSRDNFPREKESC